LEITLPLRFYGSSSLLLILALVGLVVFLLAGRELSATTQPSFAESLAAQRHEMTIGPEGISGPGAELLLGEAEKASYVLIGEEHGIAEVGWLTRAIYTRASPPFSTYAGEVGNMAAEKIKDLAQDPGGLAAFDAFQKEFPFAFPFATFKDDAELLGKIAKGSRIVGLDQEFLLSTIWLLSEIEGSLRRVAPAAATEVAAALKAEREVYRHMDLEKPETLVTFLNQPLPPQWPSWKAALAGQPHALAAMAALEESQHIYELYQEGYYHDNNDQRGRVMKEHWRAAGGTPRALIRLGANHVIRGYSPLGISDFGNFTAELAAAQGLTSLHLLALPTGGAKNIWLPFLPDDALASPIDIASEDFSFYYPLLRAIPPAAGPAVYDLRPLRAHYKRMAEGSDSLEKILLGYDLFVSLGQTTPATLLPSLHSSPEGHPAPAAAIR